MKFHYRVYMAPHSCDYGFMSYDYAMSHGFSGRDYVSVWYGEIEADNIGEALELIYIAHNRDDRPNGRGMRSLSMSDVVVINRGVYYCDSFGWTEVDSKIWNA